MKPLAFDDPILASLIKKYPAPHFSDRSELLFDDLIDAIISQQLSVKAASTILGRFKKLFGSDRFPSPAEVLTMNDATIRSAGLSFQKISYLKHIGRAFVQETFNRKGLHLLSDEEAIAYLSTLKGVGKWTAEMILIFTLNRPDVFSLGDAGLRRAMKNLYHLTRDEDILKQADTWKPYRSTASWYLWKSLENT